MFNKSYRYEPRVSSTRHERLKPAPVHSVEMLEKKIMTIGSLLIQVTERHGDTFAVSAKVFAEALKNGNTIFWCGNGGSAAESSHLAVELIGRFKNNRRPLPSIW